MTERKSSALGLVAAPTMVDDPVTHQPSRISSAPFSDTAPDVPEAVLERSMKFNIIAGSFGMFWAAVAYGMPLPLFMEAVRASGHQLGMLGALRQLAMLWQIPAAFFVERTAARKPLWLCVAIVHRLMWAIPALCPLVLSGRRELYPVVTIAALAASDILGNIATAPWLSWMADLLPAHRSGHFWGRRQRLLSLAIIAASGIYGMVLDHYPGRAGLMGFALVFAAAALAGVMDIVVHAFVFEPKPVPHPQREHWIRRIVVPLQDRELRLLTVALGAWSCAIAMPGISNGLPGFFNVVYLKENFGATYSQASLLFIASAVGAFIWTPRIGRWIDRRGAKHVAICLMLAGPAVSLTWLFVAPHPVTFQLPVIGVQSLPQPVLLMSAASLLIGGWYSGILICQLRLTAMHTPAAGRTVAMAVHWSFVGLISSAGPLIAGLLKDHFPSRWSAISLPCGAPLSYFQCIILLQVCIVWCIAVPILRRVTPHARPESQQGPPAAYPRRSLQDLLVPPAEGI